jgi:hypothetical protein
MVAQTFVEVSEITKADAGGGQPAEPVAEEGALKSTQLFAIGICAQSWMTGFLVGKISSGSFATGFKYALMLLGIAIGAIVMTQEFNLSPSMLLNQSNGSALPGQPVQ